MYGVTGGKTKRLQGMHVVCVYARVRATYLLPPLFVPVFHFCSSLAASWAASAAAFWAATSAFFARPAFLLVVSPFLGPAILFVGTVWDVPSKGEIKYA